MAKIQVAIMGRGGFAREVLWCLRNGRSFHEGDPYQVVAFVDLKADAAGLHGLPIVTLDSLSRDVYLMCGIGGMPELKQRVMEESEASGFRAAPAAVFDGLPIGPNVEMGDGTVVCAGNILTVDVRLGRHVAVNLNCTVGHDSVIGDYSTLSPGTQVSGNVTIGVATYAGTGCSIIEGIETGPYSVIAAGAVVTKPVPERALVVGVPAQVKKTERKLVCPVPSWQPA